MMWFSLACLSLSRITGEALGQIVIELGSVEGGRLHSIFEQTPGESTFINFY